MLKTLQAEIIKTRHNKLFLLSGVFAFLLPLLTALKDAGFPSAFHLPPETWATSTQDIGITVLINLLSGIVVTLMFQKEYAERTIIGQLTAPISRNEFLWGKLCLWGIWHMVLTILCFISTIIGLFIVYQKDVSGQLILSTLPSFLKHGLLSFLSLSPLMAVGVLQKGLFYPSVIICLFFTLIASSSYMMQGSLPYLLPWSAARMLSTVEISGSDTTICILSVTVCFVIGILAAFLSFRRQKI